MAGIRRIETADDQNYIYRFVDQFKHGILSFLGSITYSVTGAKKVGVELTGPKFCQHSPLEKLADLLSFALQHCRLISDANSSQMFLRLETLRRSFAKPQKKRFRVPTIEDEIAHPVGFRKILHN